MTPLGVTVLIAVSGFLASIGTSAFLSGTRWGKVSTDIDYIKRDVAEIKGMFTLSPRAPDQGK